jgi:hypothetical protein
MLAVEARTDAAKELDHDGQIARTAKHNALAALATGANLMKRGYELSKNLSDEELQGLTPLQRIKALKTISEFQRNAADCADAAVRLERLILGEPDAHVEHEHKHVHVHVPAADMVATIDRANAAVQRAVERGIIDVDAKALPADEVEEARVKAAGKLRVPADLPEGVA